MLYKPGGCAECNNTGYRGRTGIYEMMLLDDELRQLTLKNVDSGTIKRQAVSKGMRTLMDDGAQKVMGGVSSVAEVLSVTQEDMA
jgi:general secretion pathway protein E